MKRKIIKFLMSILLLSFIFYGCSSQKKDTIGEENVTLNEDTTAMQEEPENHISNIITLTEQVQQLKPGLSAVQHNGDYGLDEFISGGGASSDREVVTFVMTNLLSGVEGITFGAMPFGCSTISAQGIDGTWMFGRNFDWNTCDAMIVSSYPENDYASIATVNTDFINISGIRLDNLPDEMQALIALYAPLDGMNEKGLVVSVNMIQDGASISQDTDKLDLTTTTAVRLLLDKAADAKEAVELLGQYDLHSSMGMMVHFAIADAAGNSVVVEYINNEMVVTHSPVVTNFYLSEGEKYGIGTQQSHTRYDILMAALAEGNAFTMEDMRDTLDSVSKDNFGSMESTEWSIVFNQSTGEVHYYHREDYVNRYTFCLEMKP